MDGTQTLDYITYEVRSVNSLYSIAPITPPVGFFVSEAYESE